MQFDETTKIFEGAASKAVTDKIKEDDEEMRQNHSKERASSIRRPSPYEGQNKIGNK